MKRAFINDYLVDGKPLLEPDAGVELSYASLEGDSGTDESGVTHRIVIRHDVRTWGFSYAVLTAEEFSYLRSLLKGKSTFSFSIIDDLGGIETVTAYSKDISVSYFNKHRGLYKNFKIEIVEC